MSSDNSSSNPKTPLASLAALAKSTGNLLPSFENVQSPSVKLPSLFSKVSFDSRKLDQKASASKPVQFRNDNSAETPGVSVSGKSGGGEQVGLFVYDNPTVCCGQIGTSDRFCVANCLPGETRCDIKSHHQKADVKLGYVYICAPATKKVASAAFQHPYLPVDVMSDKLEVLKTATLSVKTWNRLFAAYDNIKDFPVEELQPLIQQAAKDVQVPFTAVKRKRIELADELPTPKLPPLPILPTRNAKALFEDTILDKELVFQKAWSDLIAGVEHLQKSYPELQELIAKIKIDMEIAVQEVEGSVEMINIDIGSDPGIDQGSPVTSIWSGIQLATRMAHKAQTLANQNSQAVLNVNSVQRTVDQFSAQVGHELSKLSSQTKENEKIINHIVSEMQNSLSPTIQKLVDQYIVGAGTTNLPLGDILSRLRRLETTTPSQSSTSHNSMRTTLFPNIEQPSTQPTNDDPTIIQNDGNELTSLVTSLANDVRVFTAKYSTLEDRLQSESVTINNITFGSLKDTNEWVKLNVPGYSPDGFHDIMSLLQTVTEPHIAFNDGMNEAYMSRKVGFETKISAIIAHSFKIELPDIFGKFTATSDKSFPLPAIKNYKQWNPSDGVSGVMRYTTEQLVFQVESCKAIIFHEYQSSKSLDLASQMLSNSHSFWTRLSTWMNEFYLKLTIVSSCSVEEAWLLVASCVRGMFKEFRRARIVAQNADTIADKCLSTAYSLWGSLQAHRVMKSFLIKNFESHPSITPIINMHLFQFRVPMSLFVKQKEKITALETSLKQLRSDVDRLKNVSGKKKLKKDEENA